MNSPNDVSASIRRLIVDFIASSENKFNDAVEPAWAEPLVGFSSGSDPLYDFYKSDIGDFYLKPIEFFRHAYPSIIAEPDGLTVISWVLPQTDATKRDHRKETKWPSERWARSRIFGEQVNSKLRRHLVQELSKRGIPAVAPMLSPLWREAMSEKYLNASSWSERHAAYAAGLGTFGLSDGLITPKGKAHRVGSVIAMCQIEPTHRPYSDHHAYCLFYSEGNCGECIGKCPVGAITFKGHDKVKCAEYVDNTHAYVEENFGFKGYGCGLCQVGVPCESRIPKPSD